MADRLTVARPYARAAFRQAQADAALDTWSEALQRASIAMADPRVRGLLGSPKVTGAQLADLVAATAADSATPPVRNFIGMLAENGRLPFLPEISQLFEQLKADAEGVVDVQITSAAPMSGDEQGKLVAALEKRFGRKVHVQTAVDASLVGGAVVRAGDLTIDGSLKSRLERLALDLTA
jgi:F-type H+-transporting ATPase subunit delta